MSPYLGLLDRMANELTAKDYCRLDVSGVRFKISPGFKKDEKYQVTFILDEQVSIKAKSEWGWVAMVALFYEAGGDEPFCRVWHNSKRKPIFVHDGDTYIIPRGGLAFPVFGLPWEDIKYETQTTPVRKDI